MVLPLFRPPRQGPSPAAFRPEQIECLLLELNLPYLRQVVLPEQIERHLGGGSLDYQVEVVTRSTPPSIVYQSDPGSAQRIADIVKLLDTITPAERERIVGVLDSPPLRILLCAAPPISAPAAVLWLFLPIAAPARKTYR